MLPSRLSLEAHIPTQIPAKWLYFTSQVSNPHLEVEIHPWWFDRRLAKDTFRAAAPLPTSLFHMLTLGQRAPLTIWWQFGCVFDCHISYWGRVSSEDEKRVSSCDTRSQREHILKNFNCPMREWAKWVSEPVNGASAALRSKWAKWTVRGNKRSERPSGLFKKAIVFD